MFSAEEVRTVLHRFLLVEEVVFVSGVVRGRRVAFEACRSLSCTRHSADLANCLSGDGIGVQVSRSL